MICTACQVEMVTNHKRYNYNYVAEYECPRCGWKCRVTWEPVICKQSDEVVEPKQSLQPCCIRCRTPLVYASYTLHPNGTTSGGYFCPACPQPCWTRQEILDGKADAELNTLGNALAEKYWLYSQEGYPSKVRTLVADFIYGKPEPQPGDCPF